MAFTLTAHRFYPEGTTVTVYPASRWLDRGIFIPEGAPLGAAVDTADVTSGVLTFANPTNGTEYLAYAEVGSGNHRYVRFRGNA